MIATNKFRYMVFCGLLQLAQTRRQRFHKTQNKLHDGHKRTSHRFIMATMRCELFILLYGCFRFMSVKIY